MHQHSLKMVRRPVWATLIILGCVTLAGCSQQKVEQPATVRLVERELRREFNTRYIHVSQLSADTLEIRITGGRLQKGANGPLQLSEIGQATLARRAVQYLSPDPARPLPVRTIVVDMSQGRRFGPLVFDRKSDRSVHDVATLLATQATDTGVDAAGSKAVVRLQSPADSVAAVP